MKCVVPYYVMYILYWVSIEFKNDFRKAKDEN